MITFSFLNTNSLTMTYGGSYTAGNTHDDFSENRLNSLYFKCYEYNTLVSCPTVDVSGNNSICLGASTTLQANISYSATKLKPVNSYMCLNPGNTSSNNASVIQTSCTGTAYENWQLELVPGFTDRYFIKNLGSNLYIRPLSGGTSNGTVVTQASGNDATFHWQLVNHSIGRYHIKHVSSGRYFDVSGGSTSSGASMIIWDFHGGINQQFYIDNGSIPYPSSSYNYAWSNGATTSSISVTPGTTQTYTVSITSSTNNCIHWFL
jgi:Ricin-type beta-trefoil lectin domain-like